LRRTLDVFRRVEELARLSAEPVRFRAEPARLRADDVVRFRAEDARLRVDVVRLRAADVAFFRPEVVRLRADVVRLRADDVVRLRAEVARFRVDEAVFRALPVARFRVDPRDVVFRPREEAVFLRAVVFFRDVPERLRAVDDFLREEPDFRRVDDLREVAARARLGVERRCVEPSSCSSRPSSSSESPFPMIFFAIPTAAGTATPMAAPAAIFFGVESPSSSSGAVTSSSFATTYPRGRGMELRNAFPARPLRKLTTCDVRD
jgi:hypothetical protein